MPRKPRLEVTACIHVNREHYAKGLCKRCYYDVPAWRNRNNELKRLRRARSRPVVITIPGEKTCTLCRVSKVFAEFYTDISAPSGRSSRCIPCVKGNRRFDSIGMTPDHYNRLKQLQGNLCAICKYPEIVTRGGIVRELAADHNHTTKKLRGLLCAKCNAALGLVRENTTILQSMIEYIQRYARKSQVMATSADA